ncbi:hypothetical protein HOG21_05945 [bacterium]|nr:hypothetical protein [bacterium]
MLQTIKSFFTQAIFKSFKSLSSLSVNKKTNEFFIFKELKYFNHLFIFLFFFLLNIFLKF